MNILLSTDNNYVMPTGVLMTSIGINCGKDVCYYIMTDIAFSEDNRAALSRVAKKYGNTISFYPITPEMTKDLPFGREDQPKGVSIATYYRLFITEILPKDVHKILYLDGDMIVRHNLDELWNTDLTDYAVGVVHDCDEDSQSEGNRLSYPMESGYFNAGMLLINLDFWRGNGLYQMFMKYTSHHQKEIIYHDQDVLNATLWDKRKWMPLTYNFQSSFIFKPKYAANYKGIQKEIDSIKNDPVIIHYVSSNKPWNINCFFGYRGVWRYYWRKTQWYKNGLENDNPKTLKEHLRNFALRHQLFFPERRYQKIIINK